MSGYTRQKTVRFIPTPKIAVPGLKISGKGKCRRMDIEWPLKVRGNVTMNVTQDILPASTNGVWCDIVERRGKRTTIEVVGNRGKYTIVVDA